MEEYKGNSNKKREVDEEKKEDLKPVVRGNVKIKKEPLSRKFSDVFLSDTVDNVKSYVIFDVIVPAIKNMFVDSVTNSVELLVNGGRGGSRRSSNRSSGRTQYNRMYDDNDRRFARPLSRGRDRCSYADIIFETRGDATEVIDCMYEILDKYKMVSVADYYEIAGAADQEQYTDRNYGWFELDNVSITRDRDGYRISLPRPESLK